MKLDGDEYCGGVADIAKFFDQIRRPLVYKLAEAAGMPPKVLTAYRNYLENLTLYNALAGGMGKPYSKKCGIPQGCPLSMVMVALIMRPWIAITRTIPGVSCYILADDVLVLAEGATMVGRLAEALDATHEYLNDMGAKVEPAKSYNFASSKKAAVWLKQTTWDHIGAKIKVVTDLRYLGAHLTTRHAPTSPTMDARFEKAITQLKKLRYVPAAVEAKVGIILAKTYVAAFYGIEAAKVQPAKIARITAAVVDVFRSRNANRNIDRFFSTLTDDSRDLDPVVQIYGRRAMQVRRSCCKNKEAEKRMKETVVKYATKHKIGGAWPKWYHDVDQEDTEAPATFPQPQPHPSTKGHSEDWDKDLDAVGPVGLLIESVLWCGMVIDKNLNVWQKQEEPVSILDTPYQT